MGWGDVNIIIFSLPYRGRGRQRNKVTLLFCILFSQLDEGVGDVFGEVTLLFCMLFSQLDRGGRRRLRRGNIVILHALFPAR